MGATVDPSGVRFALFSAHADAVDLCLFDRAEDRTEAARIPLTRSGDVWHGYVPGLATGSLYGYRVSGPWDPPAGHRFNRAKVLLDPYARALGRPVTWHPSLFAHAAGSDARGEPDESDSAPFAPLARVVNESFDWESDAPPATAWHETVIYEAHVKGFTALNHHIPAELRGTYRGLASEPAIRHLLNLGVTAVELMPIHAHADERRLAEQGRVNYWGYNTLAFFVADARFAVNGALDAAARDFKTMVRALHRAGIEVILDVVYNHTAEGDELGPTLSFRGIDNATYYRLDPSNRAKYQNFAGTGNVLDLRSPAVFALVIDSLRYWIEEMHVDGFRFDLTSALARDRDAFNPASPLLEAVARDPLLSRVKVIAEPWDAAPDGFQLGRFPKPWAEWNGRYRDDVRRFWRGDPGMVGNLATRLAGSSDIFQRSGRGPTASVNFVTSHDGFTLADLVSFADKHNETNGEGNHDGESQNFSWNSGVEGPATDPVVIETRARQCRNVLLTLLVSLGVPMISGGDEVGRSQRGNNNAYCVDDESAWTPWDLDATASTLLTFTQRIAAFRRAHPRLQRQTFLEEPREGRADVRWLTPEGRDMTTADWQDTERRSLGMLLDDDVLVLVNSGGAVEFVVPGGGAGWTLVADTAAPDRHGDVARGGGHWRLAAQSAALFSRGKD
jgi:glycogen operon protein